MNTSPEKPRLNRVFYISGESHRSPRPVWCDSSDVVRDDCREHLQLHDPFVRLVLLTRRLLIRRLSRLPRVQ